MTDLSLTLEHRVADAIREVDASGEHPKGSGYQVQAEARAAIRVVLSAVIAEARAADPAENIPLTRLCLSLMPKETK